LQEVPDKLKDILIKCAPEFSKAAAKYTPPSMGKNSIEKKYYSRPYIVLIRLIRGGYKGMKATDEDVRQFKAGMIYKVLNTKSGVPKGTALAYCKRKSDLRRLTKIETRGLSRVMWGTDLPVIGEQIPPSISRLLRKSPQLNRVDLNKIDFDEKSTEVTLNIENKVAKIESYAKIAENQGYKKIMSAIMRELKKLVDKKEEL
jgi:hypothetical protein